MNIFERVIRLLYNLFSIAFRLAILAIILWTLDKYGDKNITEIPFKNLGVFVFCVVMLLFFSIEERLDKIEKRIEKNDNDTKSELNKIQNRLQLIWSRV